MSRDAEGSLRLVNARLADAAAEAGLVDITIDAATIAAVAPAGAERVPTPTTVDLAGALVLPALTEPHAHLDKAFLAEVIPNPTGDLLGAIDAMQRLRHLITYEDTVERARRAVDLLVRNGTTAIRTHADVTEANGLMSVDALTTVAAERGTDADIQIVALAGYPVGGDDGRGHRALLRAAITAGAHIVGGCPHIEDDVARATRDVLDVAADCGVGVDLHTDETLDPCKLGLLDLADHVLATGFPHPVTASHCVSLGMLDAGRQREVAARVAEAGISVVVNPDTNLYLQGRDRPTATPRGLAAIAALREAGVCVTAGSDNLQDPFNPLGRADPLEAAALLVLAAHLLPADAYDAITAAGRRTLGLPPVTIEPGAPAELIAVDAASIRETIAFAPPRRVVVHAGRVVHTA